METSPTGDRRVQRLVPTMRAPTSGLHCPATRQCIVLVAIVTIEQMDVLLRGLDEASDLLDQVVTVTLPETTLNPIQAIAVMAKLAVMRRTLIAASKTVMPFMDLD